jgi:hypothetical protein
MPTFLTPKRGLSYSQAIAEAYASAPETVVIYDTLEFRHPTFVDETGAIVAVRVVNDHVKLVAGIEAGAPADAERFVQFQPVRFGFRRPTESDSAQTPEVEITVSNVSRILMRYLDLAKESRIPIEVTYRPYLSNDLTAPHMQPPLTLTLRSVSADVTTVTARAGFGDLGNRRFPRVDYTSSKFPGLTAR